ncbi:YeiH family protein [Brevibacterium jeotgali]|uniref:Conserved hypothetical integral membrane protein n=1 Tax=Brevibacterium jeotgali TaxID=1262550 RepID=A0A2H1L4R7_9MICO|nr:putative sulfate exporter family transporter [Brevibacterium jeotgali]TWC01498.1 putative integral membrane protein (TIGR00698 family) [Brevibacterium jeotgali]SMY11897.1 conserved hypothetical integral membrane protein [Brevibacterium jeotgali]
MHASTPTPSAVPTPGRASSDPSAVRAPTRLPGLVLCTAAALIAYAAGQFLPGMSPLILAILGGIIVANLVPLPESTAPGIAFSAKPVLRAGIVLLGLQVVLGDIVGLGFGVIAVVLGIVAAGIVGTIAIGRALGLSPVLSVLVACGFSICGAAAVGAVAGVVDPKQKHAQDVVTAVALVVLFGTLMIPLLPLTASLLNLDSTTAGLWAGGAIHEVAQVVAAGGVLGGGALAIAVIVKLARVLMLAPVIAILSVRERRRAATAEVRAPAGAEASAASDATAPTAQLPPIVPLFVAGFLTMVVVRSFVPVPEVALDVAGVAQTLLLSAAMFALGCGVKVRALVQVGPRPFVLAALSTILVASLALTGMLLVG